jgi:hypothetical protein
MMIKEEVVEKQLVATEDAPRLRKEDDWRMKGETRPVQGYGLDDTKETIEIKIEIKSEIKEEDVVRQDFARISSTTKNKDMVLVAEKSFGAKGIDSDTEEEAETEVGTSAEQEQSPTDNTDNAEKLDIVEQVEMERSEKKTDNEDPGEDEREHFIKGVGSKDDSEDKTHGEMMKQDEFSKTQETIKTKSAAAVVIMEAIGMKTEVQEGVQKDTVEEDKDETDEEDMTKRAEHCLKSR